MIAVLSIATVALAVLLIPSAWGKATRAERQVEGMRAVGFPPSKLWLLALAETAGILGVLLGLWWHPLGALAALGLVAYFVGALVFLMRAHITKASVLASAGLFLLLSSAVLLLHLGSGATWASSTESRPASSAPDTSRGPDVRCGLSCRTAASSLP
ncbi:MAG TPA: DoxX family protein [Kutzneria sp.]|jgi:hypothetical protein